MRLSANVARGPTAEQPRSIEGHLGTLDATRRRSIEFILRTTAGH